MWSIRWLVMVDCSAPGFCVLRRPPSSNRRRPSVSTVWVDVVRAPRRATTRSMAATSGRPRSPVVQARAADVRARRSNTAVPLRVRPRPMSSPSRPELRRVVRFTPSFSTTDRYWPRQWPLGCGLYSDDGDWSVDRRQTLLQSKLLVCTWHARPSEKRGRIQIDIVDWLIAWVQYASNVWGLGLVFNLSQLLRGAANAVNLL